MLPQDGSFTAVPVITTYLEPENRTGFSARVDYERGGKGLYDLSEGLDYQNWRSRWNRDTGWVELADESGAVTEIFRLRAPTQLVFAFDLSMTPYFAYTEGGVTWIRSFRADGSSSRVLIPGATQPRLVLDNIDQSFSATTDLVLFFLKNGDLMLRLQREGFLIDHVMASAVAGTRLSRAGRTKGLRIQVEVLP